MLNPIPTFPPYTGTYPVGTIDVELPIYELDSPAPTPSCAEQINTVQFRVFYPTKSDSKGKYSTWLPAPQRSYLAGYIKLLGLGSFAAETLSFLPRHVFYATIPAIENAPVLKAPTSNKRWPTVIFSHGLGGCRNTYSHLAGLLASHGLVAVCPEHRDGSGPVSYIRPSSIEQKSDSLFSWVSQSFHGEKSRQVPNNPVSHDPSDEVYTTRFNQLRIRLWELGLIYDALVATDNGVMPLRNLDPHALALGSFKDKLDVHEPGRVIFAGHSFGASTIVQFLKSVFYAGSSQVADLTEPLYQPMPDSKIRRQITPQTITILLDLWCFPLVHDCQKPLFDLPLPAYAPGGPGGTMILAVESEAFVCWKEHFHVTARVLSADPSEQIVAPGPFPLPYFFYVKHSAHLSQSDFGLLFPWMTRKALKAEAPERIMRLNIRAILQVLRSNGVSVAKPSTNELAENVQQAAGHGELEDDTAILDRGKKPKQRVEAWHRIEIIGMGRHDAKTGRSESAERKRVQQEEPAMAVEIEPGASRL